MATNIAHNPRVLYHASLERITEAERSLNSKDYVLCIYLGGLAVECILQAIALHDDPTHDAKHDLAKWLARCRTSLQNAVKSEAMRVHWNRVVRTWRNDLRYLSRAGLLGYLRARKLDRMISGGPEDIMKVNAKRLLDSAVVVHNKGVTAWHHYTKR